jgi:hypothetical protein
MKIQELQKQYEMHDTSEPHEKDECKICQRWEHRFDNPTKDLNGDDF